MGIRSRINTIADAESALAPKVVEHSQRLVEYAKIFFGECCASLDLRKNTKYAARFKDEYLPVVQTTARFHDIGKAFVPNEYQEERTFDSIEEKALYKKHVAFGHTLIQEKYINDVDIKPFLRNCILEGILFHHERWDGTGFPSNLKCDAIPAFGRFIAVIDEFDHKVTEIHSEDPFEKAYEEVLEMFGSAFDPSLKPCFENCKTSFKRVYRAYINQSKTILKSYEFVKRAKNRPMYLEYKAIVNRKTGELSGVGAYPNFANRDEVIDYSTKEALVKRERLTVGIHEYFVYEALDTVNRLKNCGIKHGVMFLNAVPNFMKQPGTVTKINQALIDEKLTTDDFAIRTTIEELSDDTPATKKNIAKALEGNVAFAVTISFPTKVKIDTLKEKNVKYVFITYTDDFSIENDETDKYIKKLKDAGIQILGDNLLNDRVLNYYDIKLGQGLRYGDLLSEDTLVEQYLD